MNKEKEGLQKQIEISPEQKRKAAFVALIPKVSNHVNLSNFRSISLIGCLYKIIAKILSLRMKKVLPKVIDETQSALGGS